MQPDGKIVVGGFFRELGAQPRANIGRLNSDGTLDAAFNPGAFKPNDSGAVRALALQVDGKILVGGDFTQLGGQPRNRIGRLNSDGTLDATFNPGANGSVNALVLQSDGKVVVGGIFSQLGGQTRDSIGRLNPDGTLDTTFNPRANIGVMTLVLQSDGKIVIGGFFTGLGGQPRYVVARLNADGTLDATFNPVASGSNSSVITLALQVDNKIVVGGLFLQLNGQPRNFIGRLNANGTLDTSFNPGANGTVLHLVVQSDGKIVVGGQFNILGGQTRNRIGRSSNTDAALQNLSVNSTGTTITWLRSGTSPEVDRVTFELSTDAVNYTPLGAGTRIAGGWQLTGLMLPQNQNIFIRARGFHANSGSTSTVESVRNAFTVPAPAPMLVSAGATLVSESCPAANSAADHGERVSLSFAAVNQGSAGTANLTGVLLPSANVIAPSVPQSFGAIAPSATAARTFSFTVSGACGQQIDLLLELRDGTNTIVATLPYTLTLGCNPTCAVPRLLTTTRLERDSSNNLRLTISLQNQGVMAASDVTLTQAALGGTMGAPLPQALGSLLPGQSSVTALTFTGAGNPPGASRLLRVRGMFDGNRTFGTTGNATLP